MVDNDDRVDDPTQFVNFITSFTSSTETYGEDTHSAWSIILTRQVPGHGPVKFKVTQFLNEQKSKTTIKVECVDFVWNLQIEAGCRVVLVLRNGDPYNSNQVTERLLMGEDLVWPVIILHEQVQLDPVYECWAVKLNVHEQKPMDLFVPGWLDKKRFDQISLKPDSFGGRANRFTLKSEENGEFHVHLSVLEGFSPVMVTLMEENRHNIADGHPYPVKLSTAGLYSLLQAMYLAEFTQCFIQNAHNIAQVAEMFLMKQIQDVCVQVMIEHFNIQPFDRLLQWFLVATELSLQEGKLEVKLLKQLAELAKNDEEKIDSLKAQLEVYVTTQTAVAVNSFFHSLLGHF